MRLVDREAAQTATKGEEPIYVTLSHVWGNIQQLKLTKSNYEEFRRGIKAEGTPQCFLDAAYVTRRMGISYLWIDCLWYVFDPQLDV